MNGPGPRVLVVEDEYLIATMLADDLEEAGYQIIGPFHDLQSASRSVAQQSFDLALLDVNLNGTPVFPLAEELSRRGVPFILLTGYADASLPAKFRNLPRLTKPYEATSLLATIARAAPHGEASGL